MSSLWSVFSSESLAPKDIWQTSLASKLIPAMNRLLEDDSVKVHIICIRGVFSTGAMGALAPAILKNGLLAPAIFGNFSTIGKNCGC